jgi:hypothetical protein
VLVFVLVFMLLYHDSSSLLLLIFVTVMQILRGTIRAVANGLPYKVPATIEDVVSAEKRLLNHVIVIVFVAVDVASI